MTCDIKIYIFYIQEEQHSLINAGRPTMS